MARFVQLLSVVLVVALAVPAVFDGGMETVAKKKHVVKTKTFTNPEFVSISAGGANGASIYPSEIRVRGFRKGKVKDVNLTLEKYTHTNPDDVDIMLAAPGGRNAIVLADAGGGVFVNQADLTLDDGAAQAPPSHGLIASGVYAPVNYVGDDPFTGAPAPSDAVALSTFNGNKADGVWRLYIFDDTDNAGGSLLEGWSLTITAKVKNKNKDRKKRT